MKTRFDFVTNSSSSSFILAFNDKEDGYHQIVDLMKRFGSDYISCLLSDFNEETPIPLDRLYDLVHDDLESDAYWRLCYGDGSCWWTGKKTFEDQWYQQHPGATRGEFYDSEEFKTEKKRLVDKWFNEMLSMIGERKYIVEMEYEDHTIAGSELEHEILPNCDFTVRRFSHH